VVLFATTRHGAKCSQSACQAMHHGDSGAVIKAIKNPPGLRVEPLLQVGRIIHTKKRFVIHRRFTGGGKGGLW
jgi:hypothetical protein